MKIVKIIGILLVGVCIGGCVILLLQTSVDKSWKRVLQHRSDLQDPSKYEVEGDYGVIDEPDSYTSDLANLVAAERLIHTSLVLPSIERSDENLVWILKKLEHNGVIEAGSPGYPKHFTVNIYHTPSYTKELDSVVEEFYKFTKENNSQQPIPATPPEK